MKVQLNGALKTAVYRIDRKANATEWSAASPKSCQTNLTERGDSICQWKTFFSPLEIIQGLFESRLYRSNLLQNFKL